MSEANKRALYFKKTREKHSLELAEDYTELIAELCEQHGVARISALAKQLGVSHVTAIRTIKRLDEQGYVKSDIRQPIRLTAKGQKLAQKSRARHQVLLEFLLKLGVPRDIAEEDVEGLEHHISAITLEKIKEFLGQ